MENKLISNNRITIMKKALAAFVAGVFLFNDIAAYALSPESRLARPEFQEAVKAGYAFLAGEADNEYIEKSLISQSAGKKIENISDKDVKEFRIGAKRDITKLARKWWKTRINVVNGLSGEELKQEVIIVSIPGFLKNLGHIGHVGLGRVNGLPVIYMDDGYYYDQGVIEEAYAGHIGFDRNRRESAILHDMDEIKQYEEKRRLMQEERRHDLSYEEMRREVDANPAMAGSFHENSRPLDALYDEIRRDPDALDMDAIYAAYLKHGFAANAPKALKLAPGETLSKSVNIAASSPDSDIEDPEQDRAEGQIFERLIEITRHEEQSAWKQAHMDGIKEYLSGQDKHTVAQALYKYFDSLDQIEQYYNSNRSERITWHRVGSFVFSPNLPPKYEEDIVKAICQSFRRFYGTTGDYPFSGFELHMASLKTDVLHLLLELDPDVIANFLTTVERESDPGRKYALQIKSLLDYSPKKDLLIDIMFKRGRNDPIFAYGPGLFMAFAEDIADFVPEFDGYKIMRFNGLINQIGDNDGRTFAALVAIEMAISKAGLERSNVHSSDGIRLGADWEKFVSNLEKVLDVSEDPFVLRAAFGLYERMADVDEIKRNARLTRVCLKAVEKVSDIETRHWLLCNLIANVSKNEDARSLVKKNVMDKLFNFLADRTSNNIAPIHIDMDEWYQRQGYEKLVLDLTEIVLEPGRYAVKRKAREDFLKLLSLLNRNWWLLEDPKRGYLDKMAFNIDIFHNVPNEGAVFDWSDHDFGDRSFYDSKLNIAERIINDRIPMTRKGEVNWMSAEPLQEMFRLAAALGININPANASSLSRRKPGQDDVVLRSVLFPFGPIISLVVKIIYRIHAPLLSELALIGLAAIGILYYHDPQAIWGFIDSIIKWLTSFDAHNSLPLGSVMIGAVVSIVTAGEKGALRRLLEKIGLKYAETWYEDIKALPEVRKAYKGDLSAFVKAAEDNLDHPRTIISLAYSALMRYLEHPSTTNLGRHGWMIEDLRQKLPGIIEKKLASQDPKEKVLTVWDLGCGYLGPVLIASVILEEFDNHKEWGSPGEKIKVVIKAVDIDPETNGKIDRVLEDGFPHDTEDVLLGRRLTPPAVKDLIRRYIGFVHKKENRRRIKELGLIEFIRESITHGEQVLNPAVESGDILYMSYVLWELTDEARMQVLKRLKYIKEGALVYIRDIDSINIGGLLADIGIKTKPLYTAETDIQHSSTTHVLIEGEKPQQGHTDTAADEVRNAFTPATGNVIDESRPDHAGSPVAANIRLMTQDDLEIFPPDFKDSLGFEAAKGGLKKSLADPEKIVLVYSVGESTGGFAILHPEPAKSEIQLETIVTRYNTKLSDPDEPGERILPYKGGGTLLLATVAHIARQAYGQSATVNLPRVGLVEALMTGAADNFYLDRGLDYYDSHSTDTSMSGDSSWIDRILNDARRDYAFHCAAAADSRAFQSYAPPNTLTAEDLLGRLENADADERLKLKKQIISLGRSAIDDLVFAVGHPPPHASDCACSALTEIAKTFPREVDTAIRRRLMRYPGNLRLADLLESLRGPVLNLPYLPSGTVDSSAEAVPTADSGTSRSGTSLNASPDAPQSTKPTRGKIDYRGPRGDSGGYLNTLIKEAADAFKRGDYQVAYDKAKEAVNWFDRMDRAETDDERLEVLEALDSLEPGPEEMSDFNEVEARQARDILARAAEALALPHALKKSATKADDKHTAPPGGYKKTGVSRWPLLFKLRKELRGLKKEVVARLRSEAALGDRRKILVEAGLDVANDIDGKFLIRELDRFLQPQPPAASQAAASKHRILRHTGRPGRHLIAYSADDFAFIVKVSIDLEKTDDIVRFWVRQGYELARERLKGLAVPTIVIDATGDSKKKPFSYMLEKSGPQKSDLAIVQKKVVPVFEHLKNLAKEGKISEAKALIDKYKEFVIAMFRRGVIDNDFNNPYWNYGLDLDTGEILAFDFGDLVGDESDAYRFFEMLRVANKYFYDDLRTQVSKEVANYFKAIEFQEYDFYNESGELLFGLDLKTGNADDFRMTFPYDEDTVRHIFMNHNITEKGDVSKRGTSQDSGASVPLWRKPADGSVAGSPAINLEAMVEEVLEDEPKASVEDIAAGIRSRFGNVVDEAYPDPDLIAAVQQFMSGLEIPEQSTAYWTSAEYIKEFGTSIEELARRLFIVWEQATGPKEDDRLAKRFAVYLKDGYAIFAANLEGEIIGFVTYDIDHQHNTGHIDYRAVLPELQHRGIGSNLLDLAVMGLWGNGIKKFDFKCVDGKTESHEKYLKARAAQISWARPNKTYYCTTLSELSAPALYTVKDTPVPWQDAAEKVNKAVDVILNGKDVAVEKLAPLAGGWKGGVLSEAITGPEKQYLVKQDGKARYIVGVPEAIETRHDFLLNLQIRVINDDNSITVLALKKDDPNYTAVIGRLGELLAKGEIASGKMGQSPSGTVHIFPRNDVMRAANPMELLAAIRDDNGPGGLLEKALNEGFSIKKDLCPRASLYREKRLVSRMYYNLVAPLIDAGIFIREDGRIRFSDMMIGFNKKTGEVDPEHTRNLINVAISVKLRLRAGKRSGETSVLRGIIPAKSRSLVREAVKLHVADYIYRQIKEPGTVDQSQAIMIWKGYGAGRQHFMMQDIARKTNDRIKFEKEIDKLVEFAANPDNINKGTVTILPREKLSQEQKETLDEAVRNRAQIIYINLNEEGRINKQALLAYELGNIEGIVGIGRAYLNSDEESFYRLYSLLAGKPAGGYVPLDELKANPDLFIDRLNFILKPITANDPEEMRRLNERMAVLLESA